MVPERVGIRLKDDLGLFVRNHMVFDKGHSTLLTAQIVAVIMLGKRSIGV